MCVRALVSGCDRVESDFSEVATHAPSFQYPPESGGNQRTEREREREIEMYKGYVEEMWIEL